MDWNSASVPPLTIKNYHPDKWGAWFTQFKLFTLTTPFSSLSDSEKVAVLLLKLGTEITPIFDTFGVDVDDISYDQLVRNFNIYFQPAKARNVFLNLKQKSGETFEQFSERLRVLSYPCGFGPFQDCFLRDVFLNNIEEKYVNVRAKILEFYPDPNFQEVVDLANKLLLEECSMGTGGAAVNNVIASRPNSFGSGARQDSKITHDASQGYNRSQKQSSIRGPRHSNDLSPSFPTFSLQPINPGDIVDVQILAAHTDLMLVSPTSSGETRQRFFERLNESLNKTCHQVKVEQWKRCAVKFQREWYRVTIASIQESRETASVESLDFGWRKTFELSEFRMIPLDFVGVSPLALKVKFMKPETTVVTVGQGVRLLFVDVVNNLWTVRLADGDSLNGINNHDKKHNKHDQDRGNGYTSGADGQKSKKTQQYDFYNKQNPNSSMDYEAKGNKRGEYSNKREQNPGNRNHFRPDQQKPKMCREQDIGDKDDTGGTDCELQGSKNVGKEQHNTLEQNPGNRTSFRPDQQKPKLSREQDIGDKGDTSRTDHELKGNRSVGREQHNRRGQNPGNRNSSGTDGHKMKKSYHTDSGCKDDLPSNGPEHRGNRNSDGASYNKRDQNAFNRNLSGTDGHKMKKGYQPEIDSKDASSSNGSEYRENRNSDGANYNKRDQNAGNRNFSLANNQRTKTTSRDCEVDPGDIIDNELIGNRNSGELNNRRSGGGQNERGSIHNRHSGVASSVNDSRSKVVDNRKDKEIDRSGDSSGFRYSCTGKNQPETTTEMANDEFNGNEGSIRPSGGNKGTRNGNESDSWSNNRRSGGGRSSGGYAETVVSNDPVPDRTKLQLGDNPPIDADRFTKVIILYPVNDRVAYVYPESFKDKFEGMFTRLQTIYANAPDKTVIKQPTKGMLCAAPFEGDFYRAEILEVKQVRANVLFFDFGNEAIVPCEHLLVLPHELSGECVSFPIKVPASFKLSDVAEMSVIEVKPKFMEAGGIWVVDVGGCNNSLPSQASSSTVVITASSRSTDTPRTQHADYMAGGFKSNSPNQRSGVQVSIAAEGGRSASASSRSTNPPPVDDEQPVDDAPMRSPKPPIPKNWFSKVRVVYTGNEGTFVVPYDELEVLAEVCQNVQAAAETSSPCSTPVIQKVYAAPFCNGMYRAKVVSIDRHTSSCHVQFIDFGNECDVTTSDLLELSSDLTKRVFIFKIRLDPGCGIDLEEAMDFKISPVAMESDGSWLVQLEGEPLTADYQLPEPCDTKDSFIGFTANSRSGSRGKNEHFKN